MGGEWEGEGEERGKREGLGIATDNLYLPYLKSLSPPTTKI